MQLCNYNCDNITHKCKTLIVKRRLLVSKSFFIFAKANRTNELK
jgi:hypothetical protein